jgi:hypothetical protein
MTDIRLPVLPRTATVDQTEFPIGARVLLKCCPYEAGVAQDVVRGKLVVYWADLGYTGRHKPSTLMLAPDEDAGQHET